MATHAMPTPAEPTQSSRITTRHATGTALRASMGGSRATRTPGRTEAAAPKTQPRAADPRKPRATWSAERPTEAQ